MQWLPTCDKHYISLQVYSCISSIFMVLSSGTKQNGEWDLSECFRRLCTVQYSQHLSKLKCILGSLFEASEKSTARCRARCGRVREIASSCDWRGLGPRAGPSSWREAAGRGLRCASLVSCPGNVTGAIVQSAVCLHSGYSQSSGQWRGEMVSSELQRWLHQPAPARWARIHSPDSVWSILSTVCK